MCVDGAECCRDVWSIGEVIQNREKPVLGSRAEESQCHVVTEKEIWGGNGVCDTKIFNVAVLLHGQL